MGKFKGTRTVIARLTPYLIRKHVSRRITKHLYFSGKFHARMYGKKTLTLISAGHQIENEIYWKGFENCHEGLSVSIWRELIRQIEPNCVWDIGANSGTYGLIAKAVCPSSQIAFFEPIPKAVEMIQENLKLNKFSGNVFEAALGDYNGEGEIFFAEGADFATSVTVNKDTTPVGSRSTKMVIKVLRADLIIDQGDALIPNLIKVDVETFEPEVLNGFGKRFPERAIFLIEILNTSIAIKLNVFFPEADYNFYNINDKKRTLRKTNLLEKSDFYNYLVLPKSFTPSAALEVLLNNSNV